MGCRLLGSIEIKGNIGTKQVNDDQLQESVLS